MLTELPSTLLFTSVFMLLWRLTASARRRGPFDLAIAGQARMIGWLLVAGGFVANAVQQVAELALLRTMLEDGAWNRPAQEDLVFAIPSGMSLSLLITGLGLLTVARILRAGVRMREDLARSDLTVAR